MNWDGLRRCSRVFALEMSLTVHFYSCDEAISLRVPVLWQWVVAVRVGPSAGCEWEERTGRWSDTCVWVIMKWIFRCIYKCVMLNSVSVNTQNRAREINK